MNTCEICDKPALAETDYKISAYVNCVDGRLIDLHGEATFQPKIQDRSGGHYGPCIPGSLCKDHFIQLLQSAHQRIDWAIDYLKRIP